MRAKFINEIKQNKVGSGLGSIGIGKIRLLNIPNKLKEMARTWDCDEFEKNCTSHDMNATYKLENGLHILTFDYVGNINLPNEKIKNPRIEYDEKNQLINIFHGGIQINNNSMQTTYEKFDLYNEKDFNNVIHGLNGAWVMDFYYSMEDYILDYGGASGDFDDYDDYDED